MRLRVESQSSSGIHESDFTPEDYRQISDPRQMAENSNYTPTEKADFYQRYLEKERRSGFKKLLAESESWPLNWRLALDEALSKTPLALGYAARLPADEQIKFLNRMLALGYHDNSAAEAFVDLVNAASLNNIASRLNELIHLGERSSEDSPASGMYFMKRLAERASELSLDAQKVFAKSVMDFDIFQNDLLRNESFRRQVLLSMFAKMNPDALSTVLDELQSIYKSSDLLRILSGEFDDTQE
jgi:hypothetical protein